MKGIEIRKIKLVHEDERRKIMEIMNGELQVKNLKILEVKEKIEAKEIKKEFDLAPEEKTVFELVQATGTIFQSELVEKTQFSKVKITRILDRLEGKGLVERRRRGMTNVIILKEG